MCRWDRLRGRRWYRFLPNECLIVIWDKMHRVKSLFEEHWICMSIYFMSYELVEILNCVEYKLIFKIIFWQLILANLGDNPFPQFLFDNSNRELKWKRDNKEQWEYKRNKIFTEFVKNGCSNFICQNNYIMFGEHTPSVFKCKLILFFRFFQLYGQVHYIDDILLTLFSCTDYVL